MPETAHYRIRHTTSCHYTADILLAHHLLHLSPRDIAGQRLLSYWMDVEPRPVTVSAHLDYFGNPTTYLSIQEPHRDVVIHVAFDIEVAPPLEFDLESTPPWETLRDQARIADDADSRAAARFAYATDMIPVLPELLEFVTPSFPTGRPVAAAALDLIRRINDDFTYDPVATTIATPLTEVLEMERGVCQDFAHLAIGCLRALGLPARYVSGYLRTIPPEGKPRLIGADGSHAWLSVWCGGDTWLDLDPTNGQIGSTDYITLAWGRDYADVSPTRGVLIGGGRQGLVVEVDVEPLNEAE